MEFTTYRSYNVATESLHRRGYNENFFFNHGALRVSNSDVAYAPRDLWLAEFHRFSDVSDEEESTVIFAVETRDQEHRGLLTLNADQQIDMQVYSFLNRVPVKRDSQDS